MTTQIIIRIDPHKREQLKKLSKAEGKATSEVIRELIDNFIKDHDMDGYIDDLWKRTGTLLTKKGLSLKDVNRVIKESRIAQRAGRR
jgi:predicted DNA-binding protein